MRIVIGAHTVPQSKEAGVSWGIGRATHEFASDFIKRGHDVNMWVRAFGEQPIEDWIHPVNAPKQSWILYPPALYYAVKPFDAEVCFADYPSTGKVLCDAVDAPCAVGVYDSIPWDFKGDTLKQKLGNKYFMYMFNKVVKANATLLLLSQHSKDKLVKYTGINPEQAYVVHEGVSPRFHPLARDQHDNIRVGYLGGIDGSRKNFDILLNAWPEIKRENSKIELHVAGGSPRLEQLKANYPDIRFHGFVPYNEINQFYNDLDVFVYTSISEGFAIIPCEAMACGTPTVVINEDCIPESVAGASVLYDNTPHDLARQLLRVIDSDTLQRELRTKGFKRANELSMGNYASNIMNMLEYTRDRV